MELRHLRYFCGVAELRSFTLAARQLNISQSGVSGQIRDLETEIGVKLLHRNQREVSLTPEGMAFWGEAREILARVERAVEITVKTSAGGSGKLTVGLCGPVTAPFLPRLICKFRRQFPGASVALKERAPAEQVDALVSREIDISFSRSIPADLRPHLNHELLLREPVVLAMHCEHPFSALSAVPVRQLAKERLVLYDRAGAPEIFDAIIAMCKRARFSPRIADSPRSWQAVLTMTEAGEGIAVVPACVRHLRADDVVFRPLKGGSCTLDAIVAWRRNEPSALLDGFLSLLRSSRPAPVAI